MEDATVALVRTNAGPHIGPAIAAAGETTTSTTKTGSPIIINNNNNNKFDCANGNLVEFCGPAEQAAMLEGVEILVVASSANSNAVPPVPRKEDEQITSAVMKVLQGYQWSLVPTPTKCVLSLVENEAMRRIDAIYGTGIFRLRFESYKFKSG